MKRQINSEAELVNALCKGVGITCGNFIYNDLRDIEIEDIIYFSFGHCYYEEPVEVVELWSYNGGKMFVPDNLPGMTPTHKQTQIHQNGEIIWTETIKIK